MSPKTEAQTEARLSVPTMYPPEGAAEAAVALAPLPLQAETAAAAAEAAAVPVQEPPAERLAAESAAVWNNTKLVTGLWTNTAPRNSWMHVGGIGWKKLSTANDSGNVALTVLASSARITGTTVNYRDEADGMVHEIYLW